MVQDMHHVTGELEGEHVTLPAEAGYLAQHGGIFHQVIQRRLPPLGLLPQLLLRLDGEQSRLFLHQR